MAESVVVSETRLGREDGTPFDPITIPGGLTIEGRATQRDRPLGLSLDSVGALSDQAAAKTEMNRWLTLIRAVGTGAPPHATLRYTGGDVCDGTTQTNGNRTWVMADWLANISVDADDTYAMGSSLIPTENGAISETSPGGTFTLQLYASGSSGPWLDADVQGGLLANTIWWPLSIVEDVTNELVVGCWWADRNPSAGAPYGIMRDSTVIKLNIFGGYASHTMFGMEASHPTFFIECMRRVAAQNKIYILGGQFNPVFNGAVGQETYAVGTYDQLLAQKDMTHRLGRVDNASIMTRNTWEFWNGTSWVADYKQATVLRDVNGREITGSAGISMVRTNYWLLVAHHMVDDHIDVYHYAGEAPTGPWRQHARVPLPVIGHVVEGGIQIAWHTKIIEFLTAPVEHSMACMTCWYKDVSVPATTNIRRFSPHFVAVPWY